VGPDCQGADCDDGDPSCWEGECCPAALGCGEVLECVLGCGQDVDCATACYAQGTPEAQALMMDLAACAQENLCGLDPACIAESCDAELEACTADVTCQDLDGDGYGQGAGCAGPDCDDADPSCWEGACCPAACTDLDGDGYGQGAGCAGPDCDDADPSCWEGACCPAALGCGEVLECALGCGQEAGCVMDCFMQGTPEAQALMMDVYQCAEANLCGTDPQCIAESCEAELQACLADADCTDQDGDGYGAGADCLGEDCDDADPSCWEGDCCSLGTLSCSDVLQGCLVDCQDVTCQQACIAEGDTEAQQLLEAIVVCAVLAGCALDDTVCILEGCEAELTACLDDV